VNDSQHIDIHFTARSRYILNMGKLEKEAKRTRRLGYVQQAILVTIAISGMLAIAAIAPNVLQLLGWQRNKHRFKNQAKTALGRLKQMGYIEFVEKNGVKYARTADSGRLEIERGKQRLALTKKIKHWDKRYRIVIFDIPERRKSIRDKLRRTMTEFGFLRLQDSVWVYPHDCEDLIALVKTDLRLGYDVLYLIVEKIENDKYIREHFGI
jgi:CRISPR-associated endonuclease Cas2